MHFTADIYVNFIFIALEWSALKLGGLVSTSSCKDDTRQNIASTSGMLLVGLSSYKPTICALILWTDRRQPQEQEAEPRLSLANNEQSHTSPQIKA